MFDARESEMTLGEYNVAMRLGPNLWKICSNFPQNTSDIDFALISTITKSSLSWTDWEFCLTL